MEIIDQTRQVLLKDKPFMTLTEAARYTGVGQHKLSELSDDPECEFVFWVGKKRMFKREKLVDYLSLLERPVTDGSQQILPVAETVFPKQRIHVGLLLQLLGINAL